MRIEPFFVEGPAGRIECFIKHAGGEAASGPVPAAAVVCHPHPLFGGTMHDRVVHAAAGALADAGQPVVRFNFRGVGLSAGEHDAGHGELDDLRAVLDHLAGLYPSAPLVVAGYSFGAWVGLRVGRGDERVAALIGIGLPVTLYDFSFLRRCGKPVTIIQGDRDRFGPMPLLLELTAALEPGAPNVIAVPGAGHDFEGRLDEVARGVAASIPPRFIVAPAPPPS